MNDETHRPAIVAAIDRFWIRQCRPPTIREIAALADVPSLSNVNHHLKALQKAGRITMVGSKGETRRVVPEWVARAVHEAGKG